MKLTTEINGETLQDLIGLETGLYYPLKGFLTSLDYHNVVERMKLSDNSVWSLPITLDVNHEIYQQALDANRLYFTYQGREIGYMETEDCYKIKAREDVVKIFKTGDTEHPGVKKELSRSQFRIGGKTKIIDLSVLEGALNPENTRAVFANKGWKTVVGFQTRNPIHRAHEHLQRVGLDICEGLFINPSVGWKKPGDFSEAAVMAAYRTMIDEIYPEDRVHIEGLRVYFRYAGPREAIYHAILRRNLGCTHFIIGRDHAGVGGYYGSYEAQELAAKIATENDLGIDLLLLKEPFYCQTCGQIVSERHCKHTGESIEKISGTKIRAMLKDGKCPDEKYMRPEVARAIIALGDDKFISESE
ncbi:MAG: sulfate adenylyltransferase [bacterium]|nr:sulfate adenylyltransferase [bacterium]